MDDPTLAALLALPPEHPYWRNEWMFTRPVMTQASRQGTDPTAFWLWALRQPRKLLAYISNPPTA